MTKWLIAALLGLGSALNCYASPPASWPFISWKAAVAKSKAENKPLFVLFGYTGCLWCYRLDIGAMRNKSVRKRYSADLVMTYVDTQATPIHKRFVLPGGTTVQKWQLLERHNIDSVPSWIYLAPTGGLLNSDGGGNTLAWEMQKDLTVALKRWATIATAANAHARVEEGGEHLETSSSAVDHPTPARTN